jgi:hypothetical protein
MLGESSINLTGLTTYESAKPPGPYCDLFHPEFFEPADWLKVFTNASVEVVELALALFSVPVLNE